MRIVGMSVLLILAGCSRDAQRPPAVVLSDVRVPGSLPVYVAVEKGFFRHHGIEVTLLSHATGRETLQELHAGKAHAATAADVPLTLAALDGKTFAIVASIASTDASNAVVARTDRVGAGDLRGKKVGFTPGTTADYFLDTFLLLRSLPRDAVVRVPLKTGDQVPALREGRIDALATWNPYIAEAAAALEGKADIFTERDFVDTVYCLAVSESFLAHHPKAASEMVRALMSGVSYIRANPEEALRILAKYIPVGGSSALEGYHFDVTLEHSLLINMNNESAWAKRTGYFSGKSPDFNPYLHSRTLESIDPNVVTVIR